MANGIKYDCKEAIKIVSDCGYRMLSDVYINARTNINIEDKEGCKYFVSLDNLMSGKKPLFSSIQNPHTISNIKHFLIINKCKTTLLSKEYKSCKQLLEFQCECGNIYECSTDKMLSRNKIKCNECNINERGKTLE